VKNLKQIFWDIKIIRGLLITTFIGCPIIIYYEFHKSASTPELVTPLALFLTLLAIIWYSWETRQLKIETRRLSRSAASEVQMLVKQNITSIRPYLRLQKAAVAHHLQLINEGKGIAVNLTPLYRKDSKEIPLLKIPAMAAAPGSITTSFVYDDFREELDPVVAEYKIEITYEDIEGRVYTAIFQSDNSFNDGFKIVSQKEDEILNRNL